MNPRATAGRMARTRPPRRPGIALPLVAAALAMFPAPPRAAAQAGIGRLLQEFRGEAAKEELGARVAAAGDLNGDGLPDMAIGVPGWGAPAADSTGRVLVFFGGSRAEWVPDLVLPGRGSGSQFGTAIAGVGDVNGDGFDDLVVTAPAFRYPTASQGSGQAYLYLGRGQPRPDPDFVISSPIGGQPIGAQGFGGDVTGLGDANGDGFPDWAIGFDRSRAFSNGGAAIYLGGRTISTTPVTERSNPSGGRPVLCGPGDFDGDGLGDLAIAGPLERPGSTFGPIVALYPRVATPVSPFFNTFEQPIGFGSSLAAPGDLDGDGLADLLIGAPLRSGGGFVCVWYGSPYFNPACHVIDFEGGTPDSFGRAIAVTRSIEPGKVHLLVGASGADLAGPSSGNVRLYELFADRTARRVGEVSGAPGSYLGHEVDFVGDVDGTGRDEVVIGAPFDAGPGPGAGMARLSTFTPHMLVDPPHHEEWPAGGTVDARWLGEALARLSLSLDGGRTWALAANFAGGAADNRLSLALPDTVTAHAMLRVSMAGAENPAAPGDDSNHAFSIVRPTISPAGADRELAGHPASNPSGRLGAALDGGFATGASARNEALIGAPFSDGPLGNAGAVWVIDGATPNAEPVVLRGANGGDFFGASLARGGDADGDGRRDLLVGAPGANTARGRTGRAHLILDPSAAPHGMSLDGLTPGESFGAQVRWIGDFNVDGFDDFAVAAQGDPGAASGQGRVEIFLGGATIDPPPAFTLVAPSGAGRFAGSVAGLDLNGDGAGDLAVSSLSADSIDGEVLVYLGGAIPDGTPDLLFASRGRSDGFGAALANAGDLNGDGCDDLLVGAPRWMGPAGAVGRVDEFSGGSAPFRTPRRTYEGLEAGGEFGAAVASAGDVNGDGRADFVVGAPASHAGRGSVHLYFGDRDTVADGVWTGDQPLARLGSAVSSGGDRDGDGLAEILAGAPLHTYPGRSSTGLVRRFAMSRFVVESPGDRERWFAGGRYAIRWRGAEPAEIALSIDAGRTWQLLAASTGGAERNTWELNAPTAATDSAYVRLVPTRPGGAPTPVTRGQIAIGSAVAVTRFEHELTEAGIRLTWATEPGLGAQGLGAYRMYREAVEGGARARVGPERIEAGELLVAEFERGASYVLVGVDGNGMEADLGRLTVAAPLARLRAWPVPSTEFGDVELAVFPPVDAGGRTAADFRVTVYDVSGRAVRTLLRGAMGTRVGEVRAGWDRRTDEGAEAKAGVYFVRAESPSRGFGIERRIVVLP